MLASLRTAYQRLAAQTSDYLKSQPDMIARWVGRRLQWDPVKERFASDDEANRWADRPGMTLDTPIRGPKPAS